MSMVDREIRELYPPAIRYAKRLTRDEAQAQDIVQEAMVSFWQYKAPKQNPLPLLKKVIYHSWADSVRASKRIGINCLSLDHGPDETTSAEFWCLEEDHAPAVLDREMIRDCLSHVRPNRLRMIDLVYIRGYEYQEAAKILGITQGAIKLQLWRARKELQAYHTANYLKEAL